MAIENADTPLGDAALLIDWENLKYSLQNKGAGLPNIYAIREQAESYGRVVVARAYADWQDGYHASDPEALYAAGVEPVYVPTLRYGARLKNSVDVKLSADCIELSHSYENIGTFVLATGDQDFLHVINTLRPYGKRVIIIGVEGALSARLAERVDGVLFYERDVDPAPAEAPPLAGQATPAAGDGSNDAVVRAADELIDGLIVAGDLRSQLEDLLAQIVRVVNDYRRGGRPLLLSQLGLELQRRVAAQSFAMVAKGKLKQLVAALARQEQLRVVTQGLVDWLYLPSEEAPEADQRQDDGEVTFVSGEDRRYVDLPEDERREIVKVLRDLRAQPGISFLTFKRIRDEVAHTSQAAERAEMFRGSFKAWLMTCPRSRS